MVGVLWIVSWFWCVDVGFSSVGLLGVLFLKVSFSEVVPSETSSMTHMKRSWARPLGIFVVFTLSCSRDYRALYVVVTVERNSDNR